MKSTEKVFVNKVCHWRGMGGPQGSEIFLIRKRKQAENFCLKTTKQKGDPRQKPSGMTPYFITARAFTLIELLVVVLIIGVLAAVAVPQYQKVILKTKLSEVYSQIATWQKIVEVYVLENGIPKETDETVRFDGSSNSDIDFVCDGVAYKRCINKYGAWSVGCKGNCWVDLFSEYNPVGASGWASTNEWLSKGHIAIGYGYEGSNMWKLYRVPEEKMARRLVCQWWVGNYGTNRFYASEIYSDPAELCAEVGVQ